MLRYVQRAAIVFTRSGERAGNCRGNAVAATEVLDVAIAVQRVGLEAFPVDAVVASLTAALGGHVTVSVVHDAVIPRRRLEIHCWNRIAD